MLLFPARHSKNGLPVHMDALLTMEPSQVIDPTPWALQQEEGRLWRGASIGSLALNLAMGKFKLNAGGATNEMFMTRDYETALDYARDPNASRRQFGPKGAAMLSSLTGVDVQPDLPGIVYSIESDPKGAREVSGGPTWHTSEDAPFSLMDPYSIAVVEDLLQVQIPVTKK